MTHHIILWKLKEELTENIKAEIKKNIKLGLESLAGEIPGLISIQVKIDGLDTSNVDLMLDSTFESQGALKEYSIHPKHVAAAQTYVRPYICGRYCFDFED